MAFKREQDKKGISLPGLIDIVFLLLIFSLVTLTVSQTMTESQGTENKPVDFPLPKVESLAAKQLDQTLSTLLFQIEHADNENLNSPKVVYALNPSYPDSKTVDAARISAGADSTRYRTFPMDFLALSNRQFERLEACRFIRNEIRAYKKAHFFRPEPTNAIEIRAVEDTEFRIINHILEFTSTFKDTIPSFMVRTISGQEVAVGI